MMSRLPRAFVALVLGVMVLFAGCGFLGGTNGNSPPGGIGNTNGIPTTAVYVSTSGFSPSSVSIPAGQSISFANTSGTPSQTPGGSTGGTGGAAGSTPGVSGTGPSFTVCMGQDGTCSIDKVGPTELRWPPALVIRGGESHAVVFPDAGTYHVTIEKQSGANLTVNVK